MRNPRQATRARVRAAAARNDTDGQPRRRPPRHLESHEGRWLMQWARAKERKYPALKWLFHVPNGGARSELQGKLLKAEGAKPGVPDYLLPVWRAGVSVGCAIELKAHGGRMSPGQDDWLKHLRENGWWTSTCFGWRAAALFLLEYLGGDPADRNELLTGTDWQPPA